MIENEPFQTDATPPTVTYWQPGTLCCDKEWEDAYARFESEEEEIRKFITRYRKAGAADLSRGLSVVELFCGRGNGLKALERLGFKQIEGVDLSGTLVEQYRGPAHLYVGDCRQLHFDDASKDLVVVQGGLHHLPQLPGDLVEVLNECHRVLRPNGRIMIVEPWLTPFLRLIHAMCSLRWLRMAWPKLDALQSMIERERTTYDQWLGQPANILKELDERFVCEKRSFRWGKAVYVGRKVDEAG